MATFVNLKVMTEHVSPGLSLRKQKAIPQKYLTLEEKESHRFRTAVCGQLRLVSGQRIGMLLLVICCQHCTQLLSFQNDEDL